MAIIFPGNYVERLNAYSTTASNRQGVEALPGLNFFSAVGVLEVPTAGIDAAVSKMKVLSPDMRSDDKPRLDKDMAIPINAEVYSVAIRGINVKDNAAASKNMTPAIAAAGTAFQTNLTTGTTITSAATTFSMVDAKRSVFTGFAAAQTQTMSAETTIYLKHNDSSSKLVPIDTDDQAAVIIEVCYFLNAEAPTEDDVNLPFKTEAGSS